MNPLVKWPGGKRQLAEHIINILGREFNHYYEPFLGGGGVLIYLQPIGATCFDINPELINMYNVVKYNPEELIDTLYGNYIAYHSKEFYYQIRDLDRNADLFGQLTQIERAARFLYLNKTCFNGLWRVNSKGEFNVPFGRYVAPSFTPAETIRDAHQFFHTNNINFHVNNYYEVEHFAQAGDLVYFDPPYDIEDGQNGFVSYTEFGFTREDQIRLKLLCDRLVAAGVIVGVSNSNTEFIRNLYSTGEIQYDLYDDISVNRSIGAKTSTRKKINELLIVGRI